MKLSLDFAEAIYVEHEILSYKASMVSKGFYVSFYFQFFGLFKGKNICIIKSKFC